MLIELCIGDGQTVVTQRTALYSLLAIYQYCCQNLEHATIMRLALGANPYQLRSCGTASACFAQFHLTMPEPILASYR